IRWSDPTTGRLVPPVEFIPLLEETGLIMEVGAWALRQAVQDREAWKRAVNVSPVQLRRRDFVKAVTEALALGAGQPGIDLEITESLIMEDIGGNIEK